MKKLLSLLMVCALLAGAVTVSFSAEEAEPDIRSEKVQELTVTKTRKTAVSIKWSKPDSSLAEGYVIYRRTSGEKFKKLATLSEGKTSYIANGLTGGKAYRFSVKPYRYESGKVVYGKTASKAINLKTAKTYTPKITAKNIQKNVSRINTAVRNCSSTSYAYSRSDMKLNKENVKSITDFHPEMKYSVSFGSEYYEITAFSKLYSLKKHTMLYMSSGYWQENYGGAFVEKLDGKLYLMDDMAIGTVSYKTAKGTYAYKAIGNGKYYIYMTYNNLVGEKGTVLGTRFTYRFTDGRYKITASKDMDIKPYI